MSAAESASEGVPQRSAAVRAAVAARVTAHDVANVVHARTASPTKRSHGCALFARRRFREGVACCCVGVVGKRLYVQPAASA